MSGTQPLTGGTPIEHLVASIDGRERPLALKLEGANPCGSLKDRIARSLMRDLEQRQLLSPDSIVIDSTSGNLGVALAFLARARGYRFRAVVDPRTQPRHLEWMRELGAEVDMVSSPDATGGYLLSRLARVRELCASSSRFAWTNQYENPANPRAHYQETGPEILRQLGGRVDAIFVAVSTGGTLAGIGRYFRESSPSTRLIGVDARGSVVFGGLPGPRRLTGIGASRRSAFLVPGLYDGHLLVGDEEAFAFCRFVSDSVGLRLGGSSGAVLAACVRYLALHPEIRHPVCVCPDDGHNYESSIYDDAWLRAQGIVLSPLLLQPLQDLRRSGGDGVGYVALSSSVRSSAPRTA